jgi:hypothetical protein
MRRVALSGLAIALVYVAAVGLTRLGGDHDVRPLFDAVGPPPAYRWVKPPPDFAAGNIKPKARDVVVGLGADDLPPAGSSEDSQFVFNLPKGAFAPHGTDARVIAHIAPTDPDTLGPPPAGQFSDGNAYRITFAYSPSGDAAVPTQAGSVLLTTPVQATAVLHSVDGKTWTAVKSEHASTTAIGAEMPAAGYYLAVSPDLIATKSSGGGIGRLLLPIAITVAVAAALVGIPVLRRRRRPQTRQARRQAARSGRR